jgi:acetylornithine deacetylase
MNELEKKVLSLAEKRKDDLYGILSHLITFDSQNFINSGRELECANYIKQLYEDLGLDTELYSPDSIEGIKGHPGYLAGRGLENRPNVSGVLYGEDTSAQVMLAAHIDTNPLGDINKWSVDPFEGKIQDGRIYGLGSNDDKSGIASGLFALKILRESNIRLKKTVVLCSVADEEYGGGNGALAACLKHRCNVYINLDGQNSNVLVAAIGGCCLKITVKQESDDSAGPVIDALYIIKKEIDNFAVKRKAELNNNHIYAGSVEENSAVSFLGFNCGNFGSDLDNGSIIIGIHTTSGREQIFSELREIEEKVRPMLSEKRLTTTGFELMTRFLGYYESKDTTGAIKILTDAAGEITGIPVKTGGACLTDLSVFLEHGSMSSVNFGVVRDFGIYGGAHQPDEFTDCRQLLDHAKAIILFLIRYCGIV